MRVVKGNTQEWRSRIFHGEWRRMFRIELQVLEEVPDGLRHHVVGSSGSCNLTCVCGGVRERRHKTVADLLRRRRKLTVVSHSPGRRGKQDRTEWLRVQADGREGRDIGSNHEVWSKWQTFDMGDRLSNFEIRGGDGILVIL